jgi:hypothetical protein
VREKYLCFKNTWDLKIVKSIITEKNIRFLKIIIALKATTAFKPNVSYI